MKFGFLGLRIICAEHFKKSPDLLKTGWKGQYECLGPYHVESTSSRPITEVKQHWAALVLGWVTAWEYAVLYSLLPSPDIQSEFLNELVKVLSNKIIS